MISVAFREMLPEIVVMELDQLIAGIREYLFVEHLETGEHGNITALSLIVSGTSDLEGAVTMGATLDVTGDAAFESDVDVTGDVIVGSSLWLNNAILFGDSAVHAVTIDGSTDLLPIDSGGAAAETYEPYLVLRITSAINTPVLDGLTVDSSSSQGQPEGRGRMVLLVNSTTTPVTIAHDSGSTAAGSIRCPNEQNFTLFPYQSVILMAVPSTIAGDPWVYWVAVGAPPITPRQSYTPTWSTGGVQPAIGNGSLVGSFSRVGSLVYFDVRLTVGSTTTFGTGSWLFSLPSTNAMSLLPVTGVSIDSSLGNVYTAICTAGSATTALPRTNANPALGYNGAAPFAWANGDVLTLSGWYSEV